MTHACTPGPSALSDLLVLDLTQFRAGPYCTKLLAGFGAQVIKIERPGIGDGLRHVGPFYRDEEGHERSIPFLWLNTGKKSMELDLETPAGLEKLNQLIRQADVLVESFVPAVSARLGLQYSRLASLNPRLVVTSISNFGQTGPYRDFEAEEITQYALSGGLYLTGDPDRAPLAPGTAVTQYTAGMWAYLCTLAAVRQSRRTGRGTRVDLSIQESALDNIEMALTEYLHLEKIPTRKADKHPLVPWELYSCKDGHVAVIGGPIRRWLGAAEMFGEPRLFEQKFRHAIGRIEHRDELEALLEPWLATHGKEEAFHAGQARKLAFGYLASLEEVLAFPQHEARGFFVEIDHPVVGRHRYCGAPFKLSAMPWRSERAPLLGEHNQTDSFELKEAPAEPPPGMDTQRDAAGAQLPLSGVRIVDLTHYWSGPHATRILADLGAEVIKVEYVRRLCVLRGAFAEDERYNGHPRWSQVHRNKRSITLDLTDSKDREILTDLVRIADVVAENSRGGVMKRFGLAYDDLSGVKPDVILLSMPACGASGPWASYAGVGGSVEPLSGLQTLTAYEENGKPRRIKEADVTSGILGACALLTALHARDRTGEGQWIDLSQLEALNHSMMGEHLLKQVMNADQTPPVGNRHLRFAPQGCYRCKGEERWVVVTIRSEEEWRALCGVIGQPQLKSDPRLQSPEGRRRHHDELDRVIQDWTQSQDHREVMVLLQRHGIAAGAVLDVRDLASDPHLGARSFFHSAADGEPGVYPGLPGFPFETKGPVRRRGPDLGADNAAVVSELLGRSDADVPEVDPGQIGTAFDTE